MAKQKKKGRPTRAESMRTLRWISDVAGWTKLLLLTKVILEGISALFGVASAFLMRELVNAVTSGDHAGFRHALTLMILLAVIAIMTGLGNRYLNQYATQTANIRFRKRVFSDLLTKDYTQVSRVHSGEWMHRIYSDVTAVTDTLMGLLPSLVYTAVKLVSIFAAIVTLEPRILYIVLPGGAVVIVSSALLRDRFKRMHRQAQEAQGRVRVYLTERLASQLIIRTFVKEEKSAQDAEALMEEGKRVTLKNTRFSCLCSLGMNSVMRAMYFLGLAFCGIGILEGKLTYGDLTAILQLVNQVSRPVSSLSGFVPKYYGMLASAERLMEIESFTDDTRSRRGPEEISRFYGTDFSALELRDIRFTYMPPTRRENEGQGPSTRMPVVISGLNLILRRGEYVAFRGRSGSGKSTVLKLLMCLYPPDSGQRLIVTRQGQIPLDSSWRGLYAYVPQGNQLLSGTIREVLSFADEEGMRDDERLWHALRVSCADDFVAQLSNGLDTPLGEHGAGLSEGQMQRIAIARAVFSSHPILLLDECTSSLDEQTEAQLLRNLRAMTDKTVILVTHRPAALGIVDSVVEF